MTLTRLLKELKGLLRSLLKIKIKRNITIKLTLKIKMKRQTELALATTPTKELRILETELKQRMKFKRYKSRVVNWSWTLDLSNWYK